MPKVSVIIPTYNRANMVSETIKSVLRQTFTDFEIIVIDDGSTDNTMEIVSAFPVKYVRQQNQGPGAARNKGVELSIGEYIAFLDDDDAFFKHTLAKSVAVLDSHPKVAISYGQGCFTDMDGKTLFIVPKLKSSCIRQGWEELKNYLLTGFHVVMSTAVIRKSCFNEVGGFNDAFRSGSEDLDLWIRLEKRYDVAYIAEPLARRSPTEQGFSTKRSISDWEKTNSSIIDRICNDAELSMQLSHLRPIAYFRLYSAMADMACFHKDIKTALNYLFRAAKVHPGSLLGRAGLFWISCFIRTWILSLIALADKIKRYPIRKVD